MEAKITYARGHEEINPLERITFTDRYGNEYKVFIHSEGGIVINKVEGGVVIKPSVSNEIRVY